MVAVAGGVVARSAPGRVDLLLRQDTSDERVSSCERSTDNGPVGGSPGRSSATRSSWWTRLAGPAAPGRQQRRSPRGAGQDLVGTWRPLLPVARPAGPAGLGRAVLPWRVTLAHRAPFAGIATD